MKAVVYTTYGGPEQLFLREIEKPVPNDNEVLVKVVAVSINDWDWGLLQGDFINRVMYGMLKPKKQILCSDIAGRVEAVGKNITQFKPGDEVYGDLSGRWGGLAEYVCAAETMLALKPSTMSFEEAAAIPQAGMLAVQGLIDMGGIKQGQKILINGAGGGVGTLGLQVAKLFTTDITGVDSGIKLDMMKGLGFTHVMDYAKEDFTKSGNLYDLVLDVKTNRPISNYKRVLAPGGVYVTVGGSMRRLIAALFASRFSSGADKKQVRIVVLKPNKDLPYINKLFLNGNLKPVIDKVYPLEETAAAFEYYGSGEQRGKLVVRL